MMELLPAVREAGVNVLEQLFRQTSSKETRHVAVAAQPHAWSLWADPG